MLGSVQVTLAGPVTTSLVSEGPVLMLRLPPGRYTVTGVAGGVAKTTKADVGKTGLRQAALFW